MDTGIFSNTAAHQGGGIYSDNHGQLFITNGFIAFNGRLWGRWFRQSWCFDSDYQSVSPK
ncbi:MAG: hypothetical protein H6659_15855 [Ardenticatenaceae bacterium]|nr:hypothetical protein [Ardenticatenaceae bacterium]